jgi:hypothetical protein
VVVISPGKYAKNVKWLGEGIFENITNIQAE